MDRKTFIQLLTAIPVVGIPFKGFASAEQCKTQRDAEGPFYKPDAPTRSVIETDGQPLRIDGSVFTAGDCKTPIANAVLDIWHCDNHGEYDMNGFRGRGRVKTDNKGNYSFTTIYPPPYGSRPRHIHIKVKVKGQPELTTQLYFEGDPNIKNDFARNAEGNRVISLVSEPDIRKGRFDIYV